MIAKEHVCLCMVSLCCADCYELHPISCSIRPPPFCHLYPLIHLCLVFVVIHPIFQVQTLISSLTDA